jgi:flavorubredoxin
MTDPTTLRRESHEGVGRMLPIELAPGVFWMGDCFMWPTRPGGPLEHSHNNTYLIHGDDCSLIVDTGHPKDWETVARQIDDVLAGGAPEVRWIFPTHPEVTHSGNLARLLTRFPAARMIGDVRDYKELFPRHVDRFVHAELGDEVDLGGRTFVFVEAIFRDLVSTLWGFDRRHGVLFTGDGMGFGHFHEAGQCDKTTEELPDLPIAELTGIFLEYALYWTRLKDVGPHLDRLDALMTVDYPVEVVASAHGSPVMDPRNTMPRIREGIRGLGERHSLKQAGGA